MFKTNELFAYAISAALLFSIASCDDDKVESVNPDTEDNIGSPFDFITINPSSIYGDLPSISCLTNDGEMISDIYSQVNSITVSKNLGGIMMHDNKLYLNKSELNDRWYVDSYIEVIDPVTFVSEKIYEFPYNETQIELNLYSSAIISDGKLFSAGALSSDEGINNAAIISLEENKIETSFRLDFSVRKVIKAEGKLFLAGSDVGSKRSKIVVFDENNISKESMRIISDSTNIFNGNASILKDSKGRIWAAIYKSTGYFLICIDPKTETIISETPLPTVISSRSSLGIAIDKKAENIYIRCGRAFFHVNANNPETPFDISYEYTSQIVNGGLSFVDLKMNNDNKLIFINSIGNKGESSEVFELDPLNWEITNVYTTAINSLYIYVPQQW